MLQQTEQGGALLMSGKGRAELCLAYLPFLAATSAVHVVEMLFLLPGMLSSVSRLYLVRMAKLLECPWRRCRLIPFLAVGIPSHQCKWALEE